MVEKLERVDSTYSNNMDSEWFEDYEMGDSDKYGLEL